MIHKGFNDIYRRRYPNVEFNNIKDLSVNVNAENRVYFMTVLFVQNIEI